MDRRTVLLASLTGMIPWSTRAETTKQTAKPDLAPNSANEVGNPTTIRAAIALRSVVQSVIWIGVDAGYLPIDLKFMAQTEFGLNSLAGIPHGAGGIVTTRRLIASNRELVARFAKASVETIAMFMTKPDHAVPLLQSFLQISDRKAVETLHAYYAPLFRAIPTPTFDSQMPRLRSAFAREFPAIASLRSEDLSDGSFMDEMVRTGYIDGVYRS